MINSVIDGFCACDLLRLCTQVTTVFSSFCWSVNGICCIMAWFCSIGPRVLPMCGWLGFPRCLAHIKASAQVKSGAVYGLPFGSADVPACCMIGHSKPRSSFIQFSLISSSTKFLAYRQNWFYRFKFRTEITLTILKCFSNLSPNLIYISRWTFLSCWF